MKREFEVSVNAPEGTSLAAHERDDAGRSRTKFAPMPRRASDALPTAGGGFLGGVNQGGVLRAHRAARGAHFLARPPLARDVKHGRPAGCLPRQLHPARRHDSSCAPASAEVHATCASGAQRAVVQHRRRQLRHRLRPARPRLEALAEYAERSARCARKTSAASSTPTRRSSSTSPSCA